MVNSSVCRLCLTTNDYMHTIANTPLQDVYEKLTMRTLDTKDRPVVACHLCFHQLGRSLELMQRAIKAEDMLTQLLLTGAEISPNSVSTLNREVMKMQDDPKDNEVSWLPVIAHVKHEVEEMPHGEANGDLLVPIMEQQVKMEDCQTENLQLTDRHELKQETSINDESLQDSNDETITNKEYSKHSTWTVPIDKDGNNYIVKELDTNYEPSSNQGLKIELKSLATTLMCSLQKFNDQTQSDHNAIKEAYNCNQCQIHRNQFDDENNVFNCDICERGFKYKHSLTVHVRSHTGEKPFQCPTCRHRFASNRNLRQHFRIHTGEKPYQCSVCEKKFNLQSTLTQHLRIHTGEKPYKCSVCEKRFNARGILSKHLKTHTNDKPYECGICQKKFKEKNALSQHFRMHTGEKPFHCNWCQKGFNDKSTLSKHLRTHTGEKPYECTECKLRFAQKCNLRKHLRACYGVRK